MKLVKNRVKNTCFPVFLAYLTLTAQNLFFFLPIFLTYFNVFGVSGSLGRLWLLILTFAVHFWRGSFVAHSPLFFPGIAPRIAGGKKLGHPISGKKKEQKPKLLGPDIFRWDGGLPREGVSRHICWDIQGVFKKFEKKKTLSGCRKNRVEFKGGSHHDRNRHNRRKRRKRHGCLFVTYFVGQTKRGQCAFQNRQSRQNRQNRHERPSPF